MTKQYVEVKHVQALITLMEKRDSICYDTAPEKFEKYDRKVKRTIDWVIKNAKSY